VTIQPFDCLRGKTKTCWRSVDTDLDDKPTVIGCSLIIRKMHTVIIYNHYIALMYNYWNRKASRPHRVRAITLHIIWAMINAGPLHFSTFAQQLTASRFIYKFVIYMSPLSHLSVSSSLSILPMMYHTQLSKSKPCAAGLNGELCGWMHGVIQDDSYHWSGFSLDIDCSFYDYYDMTDCNCVR
jgi:hypothetical protein